MAKFLQHDGRRFHVRAHLDCYARCFDIFRSKARGALLDLVAGAGYTSHVLASMGFSVTATEINTEQFVADGVRVQPVDLNRPLPYPDGSFQHVLALEIIEHLEAPSAFVREIARVLAPGGTAVISTPNICTIASKLRFLLTNEFSLFYNTAKRLRDPLDDRAAGHISPMPDWLLAHFISEAELELTGTHYTTERLGLRGNWVSTNLLMQVVKPALSPIAA
jgi:SAM-dependent methyltransferase